GNFATDVNNMEVVVFIHGAINSASTREVYNADKKTLVQGSEVIKPANVLPAPAGISSSRRDI
ncbi:MAG: hypothetical protein SPH95_09140, partial [Candidatus Aphodosoma sp.]|nr:hypothetical protein [Candidatus Aphodosoma sp.]